MLFDRALKQTRRAALREQGLIPRPLPQIRIVRWLRAPRETYAAWSLMLLENVRSLDEAVEEVREERTAKLEARAAARSADRRERAELKAIARTGAGLPRGRGGRQVPALTRGSGDAQPATEPALAEASDPMAKVGPSALEPAALSTGLRGEGRSSRDSWEGRDSWESREAIDLTPDDDTLSLPKLDSPFDSLERKLRAMEKKLG